jgi:hypothetical protein
MSTVASIPYERNAQRVADRMSWTWPLAQMVIAGTAAIMAWHDASTLSGTVIWIELELQWAAIRWVGTKLGLYGK